MDITAVLAVCAAAWGVVMALAPMLQVTKMWKAKSAQDISLGYLALLPPGAVLWAAYGALKPAPYIFIPNVIGLVVMLLTLGVAIWLRHQCRIRRVARRSHVHCSCIWRSYAG